MLGEFHGWKDQQAIVHGVTKVGHDLVTKPPKQNNSDDEKSQGMIVFVWLVSLPTLILEACGLMVGLG